MSAIKEIPHSLPTGLKTTYDFIKDPLQFVIHWGAASDDIGRVKIPTLGDWYLIKKPEYIHDVLVLGERNNSFSRWEQMVNPIIYFTEHSLLGLEGELWRQMRKLAAPAFHKQRIQNYIPIIKKHTERMIQTWESGKVYDVCHEIGVCAMAILAEVLFSIENIYEDANELSVALELILENILLEQKAMFSVPKWIPTPRNQKQRQAIDFAHAYVAMIIQERRKSGEDTGDMISALINAVDEENGISMTDEQIRNILLSMFTNAQDAISKQSSWILYCLAKYPDIQNLVFEEVTPVIDNPTFENLAAMKYTNQVINETLRMYPIGWLLMGRKVVKPLQIAEHEIPVGSTVIISPYVLHHDERWWQDPETFDPDRFADGWENRVPKFAFLPFGGGKRICAGNHLSLMELQLIVATIVKHLKLELKTSDMLVKQVGEFSLTPENGMPLRVTTR